jgi:hypothetical protein
VERLIETLAGGPVEFPGLLLPPSLVVRDATGLAPRYKRLYHRSESVGRKTGAHGKRRVPSHEERGKRQEDQRSGWKQSMSPHRP